MGLHARASVIAGIDRAVSAAPVGLDTGADFCARTVAIGAQIALLQSLTSQSASRDPAPGAKALRAVALGGRA